jgi:hypothetical protein
MLAWKVGRVTITRIFELEIPIAYNPATPFMRDATPEALRAMPWLHPHFVTEEGALRLSIHALLVDAPGLRLVVDTCFGNDRARGMPGGVALQTPFGERPVGSDLPQGPVSDRPRRARTLARQRQSGPAGGPGDSVQPVFDAGLAQLVETDHRLSPEI